MEQWKFQIGAPLYDYFLGRKPFGPEIRSRQLGGATSRAGAHCRQSKPDRSDQRERPASPERSHRYPLFRLGHVPERLLRKHLYLDFGSKHPPRFQTPEEIEIPSHRLYPAIP